MTAIGPYIKTIKFGVKYDEQSFCISSLGLVDLYFCFNTKMTFTKT